MRICPQCKGRTEDDRCPHDGFTTVSERLFGAPDAPDPLVGQLFEKRYRVDSLIGRGGFGSVYRAMQLSISGRPVALKVLRRDLASSLEQVARFQREAHASSLLSHPNTIRVFDFGQTEAGDLFMVTELLEGEPLSRCLRREGRITPERTVRIVSQVLRSLAEAHEHGIVHRDIKPDNIFLQSIRGETDLVKVLDFGVAKLASIEDGSGLTQAGAVLGSPAYMAPEQALGKPVDARADLYAVGVVLYEMLSGRLPFVSDQIMQILAAHVVSPVPRLAELVALPPALTALVHQCLEKDPAHRPESADQLREALGRSLGAAAVPTPESSPLAAIGALETLAPPASGPVGGTGRDTVMTPPPAMFEGPHVTSAETPPSTNFSMRAVGKRTRLGVFVGLGVVAAAVVAVLVWPREDPANPATPQGTGEPPIARSEAPAVAPPAVVAPVIEAAPAPDAATASPGAASGVEPSVIQVLRFPVSYRAAEFMPSDRTERRGIETELPREPPPERRRPPRRPPITPPTPPETGLEVEWQ